MCLGEDNALLFLRRIAEDECSTSELREIFFNNEEDELKQGRYFIIFEE